MFKKIIVFIKKYFADLIIQLGIFILTNESIGIKCTSLNMRFCHSSAIQSAQIKIFAIMLISVGINIAVRKYFRSKRV